MNKSFNAYYVSDTALSKEWCLRTYNDEKEQEGVLNRNMNRVDRQ